MAKPQRHKQSAKVVKFHNNTGIEVRSIVPKTEAQRQVFEAFYENHLLLHGYAGTGKSFAVLYLAINELLEYNRYKQVVIIRSTVQTRDAGFMPGNEKEKARHYETPYEDIVNNLCSRGDAYEVLKGRKCIDFMTTAFLRGLTFENSIIVVDEVQNMTFEELDTIITRVGNGSKIVFIGDFRQSDLKKHERAGLIRFMTILKRIKKIEWVEFQKCDVVRSGLCYDYLMAKDEDPE